MGWTNFRPVQFLYDLFHEGIMDPLIKEPARCSTADLARVKRDSASQLLCDII